MRWPLPALCSMLASAPGVARADAPGAASADEAEPAEAELPKSRWHGSILHFDQSLGTQTAGIGADYQSSNPTYEWWFALKPRYYAYESRKESVSLNGWANLYWEPTNSDTTTYRNELVVGPTWLWASYGRTLFERGDVKTTLAVGPWFTLPTDKASRNAGLVGSLGAAAGIGQAFPVLGTQAPALQTARIGFEARYFHPFNRSTTREYSGLDRIRQDAAGRTVTSDLLDGSMNTQHELWLFAIGELGLAKKLRLRLAYVWLNYWDYRAPETPICSTSVGCVTPSGTANPTSYRVRPWVIASIDYDVIDEMSLSLGYYNLTSQIGPDGQRRSPFWSPDARIFLTVIGNLDAIYDTVFGGKARGNEVGGR